jgi:hypothetical protein
MMCKHYSASCNCLGTVYHTMVPSSCPKDITDYVKSGEYAGCGETVNPKDASVPVV